MPRFVCFASQIALGLEQLTQAKTLHARHELHSDPAPNWIATRTKFEFAYHPQGVECRAPFKPKALSLLPQGTLLFETKTRPLSQPVNLIRYSVLDPWPFGLTITLEPNGTLQLMMRQGARDMQVSLRTGLGGHFKTAQIGFTWDAPKRIGHVSVFVPDDGLFWHRATPAPFPITHADVQNLVNGHTSVELSEDMEFIALADGCCPVGPMPGLDGNAVVETPTGGRRLRSLKAGDCVTGQGGRPARVLWSGQARLPALGRFAPMVLRRPYLNLWADLTASGDQRVCLCGTEVEYMFGEERVTTAVRHLEIRNSVAPAKTPPAVVTYHQILLDRHDIITVNGAALESFDASSILCSAGAIDLSVLNGLENPSLAHTGLAAPVLQGFEALTLTGVMIG